MEGPAVTHNDFTEREGVIAVDRAANSARCVWRETPTRDVGIDGQIEYVTPTGIASGRIVAVQIKSGPSFFPASSEPVVGYKPSDKHRAYWARHALPVILVLHNEAAGESIWTDARAQLRDGAECIDVPRAQIFDKHGVLQALCADGALPEERMPPKALLDTMLRTRNRNLDFHVSYFDLFVGGLTDSAHSLYFGMDLATETQDVIAGSFEYGSMGIGSDEFSFLDSYIMFLIAHDLARVDYDAWRRMDQRFDLVGKFVCPLTQAGEALVQYISQLDEKLGDNASPHHVVVRERPVAMRPSHMEARVARQLQFARRFGPSDALLAPTPGPRIGFGKVRAWLRNPLD